MEPGRRIIFTVINDLVHDQRMQRICSSLASHGYRVMLVGRVLQGSGTLVPQPFEQKRLRCLFTKGKLFYLEYNLRLFFLLLFSRVDILAPVDADTLVPSFVVSKMRSRKLVFDAHEYFSEVPEVVVRPLVRRIWQWVERVFYPAVQNKYTVSEGLAEKFREVYHTGFDVIRNVPLLQPYVTVDKPVRFILYQGALNAGRALEELIMAMHHVDARLKLAGEGDLSHELRELVIRQGLQHKVEFLGWVAPADLRSITLQATVGYNLLHHTGESYYFSLSNKFFDYMHACVPSLNPAFPEYERILSRFQTGITCSPDAASIARELNRLLSDEQFYHNLQQQCIAARSYFNWQAEEQRLLAFYERLS